MGWVCDACDRGDHDKCEDQLDYTCLCNEEDAASTTSVGDRMTPHPVDATVDTTHPARSIFLPRLRCADEYGERYVAHDADSTVWSQLREINGPTVCRSCGAVGTDHLTTEVSIPGTPDPRCDTCDGTGHIPERNEDGRGEWVTCTCVVTSSADPILCLGCWPEQATTTVRGIEVGAT